MIRTDAQNLLAEVNAAEILRDKVLKASEEIRGVYVSQYFRQDMTGKPPTPMNFPFEFIATITPAIVFDNPQVNVSSTASGVGTDILKKMQFALNQWAKIDTLWEDLHLAWIDVVFSFGVIHTYLEPATDRRGEDFFKVCARRVDPRCYLMDARAKHWSLAEWRGHAFTRSKSELMDDPAYYPDAVAKLQTDTDLEKAGIKPKDGLTRDEVVIYEVWVPGVELPAGYDPNLYHGMIYQLSSNGVFLREPRPFFGPRTGPYTFFGMYVVPNEAYPLGPIGAMWDQVIEYNKHAVAAGIAAARRKTVVMVDSTVAGSTSETIKTANDGDIIKVEGLANNMIKELQFGGATNEQNAYLDRLQARLDLSYGISAAARGVSTGKGTATEAADAASQRDARTDYMAKQFTQGAADVLSAAAWYLWHSPFVKMKLSAEAALELHPRPKNLPPEDMAEDIAYERGIPVEQVQRALKWEPEAEFRGGEELHGNEHEFDDLMLNIAPYSMERTNEPLIQRRMTEFIGLLERLSQVMPQTPHIRWDKVLEEYGKVFNRTDMGEFLQMPVLRDQQDVVARKAQMEEQAAEAQAQQAQAQQMGQQMGQLPLGAGQELPGNVVGQALDAAQGVAG